MHDISYYIDTKFTEAGINLSSEQRDRFVLYFELLVSENAKFNITTILKPEEVVMKHFIDSLIFMKSPMQKKSYSDFSILKYLEDKSIIDVGTGGGFPGIPIKIMFPKTSMTLLDSNNKKMNFLGLVCKKLKLDNVELVTLRAEDAAHDDRYRERFDICVSRAVAGLSTLSEYSIPFLKRNGCFISYKSDGIDAEILESSSCLELLSSNIISDELYFLDKDVYRRLLVIRKNLTTDAKYPRRNGVPSKRPL